MTMDTEGLMAELDGDHFREGFPLFNHTFGPSEKVPGSQVDLACQVKKNRESGLPECSYLLICGSKEFIRARMEKDVALMRQLNMDVQYIRAEEYDHDFKLWDRYLQLALDKLLPLKRQAIYPKKE